MEVSDDQLIAALEQHRTDRKAGLALGLSKDQVRHRRLKLPFKGYSPQHGLTHPIPDGYVVKGVSTLYGDDGSIRGQWVKSTLDDERRAAMIEAAVKASVADLPRIPRRKADGTYEEKLLACYPIGDPHIGMKAWAEECGEDWDLAIAERVHCGAIAALMDGVPRAKRALVANMGDLFHQDGLEAKTNRSGHMLDADSRYAKMISIGVKVMRFAIERALSVHEIVDVENVPGNHDETGALWLSIALHHMYANEPRVRVNLSPSVFRYVEHGKVLIGLHHGHTCKPERLPGVMAADMAQAWGRTEFRYWYLGHVHHQSVKEHPGVTVESFNTLAAKDAWAHSGGYRAHRNLKCIVHHEDFGEVARHVVNPAMLAAG